MSERLLAAPGTERCPCDSGAAYAACCGRWHGKAGWLQAPTAEALMRSRYSAYVLQRADYLLASWHVDTRPASIEFETGLRWLGLSVKQHLATGPDTATVAFVARSKLGGRAHRLQEASRFVREAGVWYYLDGAIG